MMPHSDHPDVNLLAAFAEQRLPRGERARMLGHLADCDSCRRIAFLAQEAADRPKTVSPAFRIPAARAALAAAAGCALLFWCLAPHPPRLPDRRGRELAAHARPVKIAAAPAARTARARLPKRISHKALAAGTHQDPSIPAPLQRARFDAASLGIALSLRVPPLPPLPSLLLGKFPTRSAGISMPAALLLEQENALTPLPPASLKFPDYAKALAGGPREFSVRLIPNFRYTSAVELPVVKY